MRSVAPPKSFWHSWSRMPVRYRGGTVIAIPAVCLAITLGSWVWTRQSTNAIQQRIQRSEAKIAKTDQLLLDAINGETAVRGYWVVAEPTLLDSYEAAVAQLPKTLADLEQLYQENPAVLTEVQRLAEKRFELFAQRIVDVEQARRIGVEPAELVRNDSSLLEGKTVMDQLRVAIATLQTQERNALVESDRQLTQLQNLTTATLWFSSLASVVGYLAALYLFSNLDWELQDRKLRLQESQAFLKAVTANVVDGVITLDRQGKIETLNHAAEAMFGYNTEEVIGNHLTSLLAEPLSQSSKIDLTTSDIPLGQTIQSQGQRKVGAAFPVEMSISELQLDDDFIVIIRDITERQAAEKNLAERADELARLNILLAKTNTMIEDRNRELDKFAYVASHDLKAPLRAIANLSEWIEEDLTGEIPAENQRQLQLLRGRVHRMEALINGLLDYSRVGRTQVATEMVDVAALLADIIDLLDPPAGFTITVAPDMPTFKTKRLLLSQVFSNLLSNAVKHHGSSTGEITVSVEEQGKFYTFAVSDDGQGIAPEYHEKIFTIFQTLEARDVTENTGVGLSIVRKIIESEGGTIAVDSQVGRGTTFRFTWLKQPQST